MYFLISNTIIIAILLFLLYVLSAVWPPDSPWAPWWQMPEIVCLVAGKLAKVGKKDIVYDLGCGTGKALIVANKKYSAKAIGIEIDPLRFLLAKWYVRNAKAQVTLIKDNFFHVNISDATVVYMYLVPNALRRLTQKFIKELKPGTRIVSYVYEIPETYKGKVKLIAHDKINMIFVYRLLQSKK